MRIFRLTLFFLFAFVLCSHAQFIATKYLRFESLTINDGLSQGMVNAILQDHFGFMWFGTKDGLNRYDGYHFVVYHHNPSDTNSLSDNFIQALYEDSKGRIWIGTSNYGVDLFDRKTGTFQHFRRDKKQMNTLSDDGIQTIEEDHNGDIWIATQNGISKISQKENSSFTVTRYFSDLCQVFVSHDGSVWGSSLHNISFRIHPGKNNHDRIDTLDMKRYSSYPDDDNGLSEFIAVALEDTTEHYLYFVCEYSIARVSTITGEAEIISAQRNNWGVFGHTLCMNDAHCIWLCERNWLEEFDVKQRKWTRILSEDRSLGLMLDNANVVYRDRGGIIWVATKGYGLLKYNPRSEKFHLTDHQSVGWMSPTKDRRIAFTKGGTFINIFNPKTASYSLAIRDSDFINRIPSFSDFGITTSIVQDSSGTFWISKNCLTEYNEAANTFRKYREGDRVNFPVFVDHDNKIWTGTFSGLSRFDPIEKKFTDYQYPVQAFHEPYDFLQCIYQDSSGIFWLGTINGLLRFDASTTAWKQFKNISGDPSSLSFDLIFSICEDPLQPQKYLWIGTNGGGLNYFNKQTGKVIRYSMKDGLPNDVIYGILSDNENNLWLSTNNGLCRFNLKTRAIRNYDMKDGLQGNEFNRYSFCKTSDGLLFFGGLNGFNYFDPAELHDNLKIPEVQITDLRIRNKSVVPNKKNSALTQPAYLTNRIVLPFNQNMITFEFAAMDFTAPEKNLYRYRLDGFDHTLIESGNAHTATYTNLDPGTYTFTVQGSNSDGLWNEQGKSIQLVVLPPWWMTWWARSLFVLLLAAIIYAVYRYRINQLLKMQAVRNRIAGDLHDEIGSTLSSISIYSKVVQNRTQGKVPEAQPYLKKINSDIGAMMEAMSDIVWTINSSNDRFENIFSRMRSAAAELLEAKDYTLHFEFDEAMNDLKLDMEQRKNFYLIFKEVLNNIAKYAEGKNVWITLLKNYSQIEMKIRDDGRGFDQSQQGNIASVRQGNGMKNMKARAEKLNGELKVESERDKGTSISLAFRVG